MKCMLRGRDGAGERRAGRDGVSATGSCGDIESCGSGAIGGALLEEVKKDKLLGCVGTLSGLVWSVTTEGGDTRAGSGVPSSSVMMHCSIVCS